MVEPVKSFFELLVVGDYYEPRILQVAASLDVWGALASGPATAPVVAERIGGSLRGTTLLCDALVSLGLLEKSADRYANTPYAGKHLVRGQPGYEGGLLLMGDASWNEWGELPESIRTGRPAAARRLFHDDPGRTEILLRALYRRALHFAPPLVSALALRGSGRLLDAGGGMGGFTTAILRAAPEWRATIFDLPMGARLAREAMTMEGLADRVEVVQGDLLRDPLPPENDIVLLAALVHSYGPDENRSIVSRCAGALRPGGRLVVRDYVMSDDRTEPSVGAVFALQMLLHNEEGRCYSAREMGEWMREANLEDVQVLPPHAMAVMARKP